MKKLNCILSSMFLIMLTVFASPVSIRANEEIAKGSISIFLDDTQEDLPKENVEFACVKVANVVNGEYELIDSYKNLKINLNKVSNVDELIDIAYTLKENVKKVDFLRKTDKDGKAVFDKLAVGVYLVYASNIADYELIIPSLVAIPTFDEVNAKMEYNVKMFPKHQHLPIVQVNKVDSVTNMNIKSKAFAFSAYLDYECTKVYKTVNADEKRGVAEFRLPYGTFYIKEVKAPLGYKLSNEKVKVEIRERGVYINGIKVNPLNDVYSIRYQNVRIPSVPTGDFTKNCNFVICFCALTILIVLVCLNKLRVFRLQ